MPSTELEYVERDVKMADSPGSSDLSDPPSEEEDDRMSTAEPSSRRSLDVGHADSDHHAPPSKRRKTGNHSSHLANYERGPSSQPEADADDALSVSEDGFSDAPASPAHDEWAVREDAQTECLWRDCDFGRAINNDDLVQHVQTRHCATGGPKRTKYVCEWGECQKKASNHPSGYALKAHMRSHTKEKPYYCSLPECDKAFTRSDALAKHMRTVHEPEPVRGAGTTTTAAEVSAVGKKSFKLKLSNGASTQKPAAGSGDTAARAAPSYDEDGNEVDPSPTGDNITYVPAHHPVTGQPGFMIHYPPDIHFTAWESSIQADDLMRLLRRQIKWAEDEAKELEHANAELERIRSEEWTLKEILLEGVMETELTLADKEGRTEKISEKILRTMERDIPTSQLLVWSGEKPIRPRKRRVKATVKVEQAAKSSVTDVPTKESDPSPPPSRESGGFDGDDDPYDNYLSGLLKRYKEKGDRGSNESVTASDRKLDPEESEGARADAADILMDLSGGSR